MALLSSVQHGANGIAALLSSAMLMTVDNGVLVGMERVAILSVVIALLQPYFLMGIYKSRPRCS